MKSKEIDIDEEIDFSEEAFKKRFRRIEGEDLADLKTRIARTRRSTKSRVTIYFDFDVIERFKEMAAERSVGYQTLMNEAMRNYVDEQSPNSPKRSVGDDLLNDKMFIERLKKTLAV